MIPGSAVLRLHLVYMQILTLLVIAPGELPAIQIEPNPNPDGNTITIRPSTPAENLVPFSNRGLINIDPLASFQNSSVFNNGSPLPFAPGGVRNSGTFINSDRLNNYGLLSILEGARFLNLAFGFYYNGGGATQISGTFLNQGAVEHNGTGFTVSETGQYIQRQEANSLVTPTTVNRDMVFNNQGRVHIAAGEFTNRPFGIYSQKGTTQIDAVFQNGGRVFNDGQITVGKTGLYEHQNVFPGPPSNQGGLTVNHGRFDNAGTTNIMTGLFENRGGFGSTGTVLIGAGASFTNIDSGSSVHSYYFQPFGATTKIDGNFTNISEVQNGGSITVSSTGLYSQVASVSSPTATNNPGTFTNAGQVRIGQGTVFGNAMVDIHPSPSGLYVQQASGTTWIDGTFANSSRVENSGTVSIGTTGHYRQESSPRLLVPPTTVNTGTFTSAGQVRIGEGTSFINGTFIAAGTTNINAGVFENNGDFRNNTGQVNIGQGALFSNTRDTSSGVGTVSALYLQEVGGRTRIDGGFDNRGSVSNEGTIAVGTTGTYTQSVAGTGNAGLFQNEGRVSLSGSSSFFNTGQYVQLASGKTEIAGMFVNLGGQMSNAGEITVGTTGQYLQDRLSGSSTPVPGTTLNSGTFTNAGTVRIGEGTSFSNFPALAPGSSSPVGGQYIQQAGGRTQIDGSFSNQGGRVTNEGVITVGATGTYNQTRSSAPVPATPATANIGIFTNAGNTLVNAGTFTNHGILVNSGSFQIGGNGVATLTNYSTMINAGTFEVGIHGGVSGPGSYSQVAHEAQTIVNGTFGNTISLQAGSLSGTGTVTGVVTNTVGVVQPGTSLVPGTLTLANYNQGMYGRLDLKIGGLLAGSQYDVLKVTGPATFGGNLSVRLINGFTPGLGNTFNLLACSLGCAGLNGGSLFSGAVLLPSLASGLAWLSGLTDGGNSFWLTVVAAAASAPEPGTLVLIASGFLGLVMWWRRQGRPHASRS